MHSRRLSNSFKAASCLLLAVCWAHVLLVPFTKVEESFTLHAVHDLLHYGPAENIAKVSCLVIRVCASLMLDYGSMITLNTRVQFHALSLDLCSYLVLPGLYSSYGGFYVLDTLCSIRKSSCALCWRHSMRQVCYTWPGLFHAGQQRLSSL